MHVGIPMATVDIRGVRSILGFIFCLRFQKFGIWGQLHWHPTGVDPCPPGVTRPRVILCKILSSPTIWAAFRGHVLGPWARSGNYWPTEA